MAIIGCGRLGQVYADRYSSFPDTEVIAIAEHNPERLRHVGEKYGVKALYPDAASLLREVVPDIAAVVTPTKYYKEAVIACAEAGVKGVSADKPIGATLADVDAMVEACESRGVVFSGGALHRRSRRSPPGFSCGYTAQLPVHLVSGTDAPGQEVSLFIADDPDRADATLRVRLRFTTVHDSLTVSLNGHPLPNETCRREPHGNTPTEAPLPGISSAAYTWLEYPVPRGTLRKGANEVGVALHARPPNLQGQVVLGRLDLIVNHPGA